MVKNPAYVVSLNVLDGRLIVVDYQITACLLHRIAGEALDGRLDLVPREF